MAEPTDRSTLDVEFTYRWYDAFLERLRAWGYTFQGFSTEPDEGDALLRHDVDLSLEAALRLARFEADRDVRATYCVLLTSALYNPLSGDQRERVREIAALGHDVALHFSTHEYWDDGRAPPAEDVEARVRDELDVLGTIVPEPDTVSFHIPPAWVRGRSFDGFQSTYEPAVFEDIAYVADSTQRWREDPPAIDEPPEPLQVLTHPGLWDEDDVRFEGRVEQAIVDACRRTQRAAQAEFIDGRDA